MMEPADTEPPRQPPQPPPPPETAGDPALRAIHAAAAAAKAEPEPQTIPADFHCVGCGYPSGVSGAVICSECGRGATTGEIEALAIRRRGLCAWQEAGRASAVRRWVLIVVGYSIGAAVVARSWTILLATPTVLALAVWMSWNAGWVVARLKREDLRTHTRVVWEQSLWQLHLPWLVAPLFVATAGLAGLVDMWAGGDSGAYWMTVPFGLLLWVIGSLVAFAVWWALYLGWGAQDVTDVGGVTGVGGPRGELPLGRSEAAAFVLGVGVVLGAGGLGLGAGVVAADGMAEWLGIENLFMFDEDW